MNSRMLKVGLIILIILGFVFIACEEAIKNATTRDVEVEAEVYHGDVAGDSTGVVLAKGVRIGGEGASLAKSMLVEYVEIPVAIPNVSLLTAILQTGGSFLSGTLTNELTTEAVFSLYFSDTSGLTDPESAAFQASASMIASVTLGSFETVTITGAGGFDQDPADVRSNMLGFFAANPTIQTIYVYLVADGEPTVKILVVSLDLWMPAAAHKQLIVAPGDFTQYSENVQDIRDGELSGTITNNSGQSVEFSLYVSLVDGSYVSGDPADSDLVAYAEIAAGGVLDLANSADYLQPGGTAILEASIASLIAGESIEINLYFISAGGSMVNLHLSNIELRTLVTIGL